MSDFGIKFKDKSGNNIKLETEAGTAKSIRNLTAARDLIVIPAGTEVNLGDQTDNVKVTADITNISGCSSPGNVLTYAENITINGTFASDKNLISNGNLSELHGVTFNCDIEVAGDTVPGGVLKPSKRMTISNDASLSSNFDASAGIFSVAPGKTVTVLEGNTLSL